VKRECGQNLNVEYRNVVHSRKDISLGFEAIYSLPLQTSPENLPSFTAQSMSTSR
jgi:hypothetical protein